MQIHAAEENTKQAGAMTSAEWQKVKAIVQAAIETDPKLREPVVREKCGGDEFLWQEVNSLLEAHDAADRFIEVPWVLEARDTLPMAGVVTLNFAGKTLGHYRIISELGRGGMGIVYLAEDTLLERKVALKLLPSGFHEDSDSTARFQREARVLSALNHPNILTVHEIGHFDAVDFIAMEYVDGVTLRDRISSGRMPPTEAIDVAAQVAAAVAEAHSAGIIHRDIKPENIMIRRDGLVKVLDYGIAKFAGFRDGADAVIGTVPGAAESFPAGTPKYMSPEQLLGRAVDARSDIWSFGIVLYEMLTGHTPLEAETAAKIRDLDLPSEIRVRASTEVRRLVGRCLESDTARRYQSAGELRDDLKRLQRVTIEGPAESVKISRIMRLAPAAIVLLALLAAALGFLLYYPAAVDPVPQVKNLAVLPIRTAGARTEEDSYFADGFTEGLTDGISQIGGLRVISRTSVLRYTDPAERSLPQIARELNVEAVVEAELQRSAGRVRITAKLVHAATGRELWERSYERAERDILSLQQEITRDVAHATRIELTPSEQERLTRSRTVDPGAYEEYLLGRHHLTKRNQNGLRTAIAHFEKAIALQPDFALPYVFLADAHFALGTEMLGVLPPYEALARGEAAALKAVELDGSLAEAHNELAVIRLYSWRWDEAEEGFGRAIELNPNYGAAHSWYALYFVSQGRIGEAIARMYKARDLDPMSPHINQNVGWMLHYAGQTDEEIEQYDRALELDPNFVFARWRRASAYSRKGSHDEAMAEAEGILAEGRSSATLVNLAQIYQRAGRTAEAKQILAELQEMRGSGHVSSYALATLMNRMGEKDKAFELLESAYNEKSYAMVFIKVTRDFDEAFRADPRFTDILRRLGLQ